MPLNVISSGSDARILDTVEGKRIVNGRADVERILDEPLMSTTLDLSGHSVGDLLQLGDWLIDENAVPWFRVHAAELRRFEALRLIGCHTAGSEDARRVIYTIADVLGIEVYGATGFVFHYHYNAAGFDPAWRFLLMSASDLRYREDAQRSPMS